MDIFNKFIIIAAVSASALFAGVLMFGASDVFETNSKINGANLVATRKALDKSELRHLSKVNANWVSVVPYAFSGKNEPAVNFRYRRQWYGETPKGIIESIVVAQEMGYKVMIKPHVWVRGDGWPGDYKLLSEADWKIWEQDYADYILTYAHIADSLQAEMLCIGTEFRHAVKERPDFWLALIDSVRAKFSGKITYAANWDNYDQVTFWDKLDYIGIDAYFPLKGEDNPEVGDLVKEWSNVRNDLKALSKGSGKPILFTEYGYRSIDFCHKGHWEQAESQAVNMQAQQRAYEALYQTFWGESWFAGGFLWKWFPNHAESGGIADDRFTPQNKLAQETVKEWYYRFR
ncbi:MAG: hypothetical protein RJQ09_00145 [Cyclobacteriaceae bacterium]